MTHINGPFWRIYQFTNERRQDADSQAVYNWPCAMIDYIFNPCKMTLQFYHVLQLQPFLGKSFTRLFQSFSHEYQTRNTGYHFGHSATYKHKFKNFKWCWQFFSGILKPFVLYFFHTCLTSRLDLKGSNKPTFGLTESEILRILKSSPPRREEKARYIGPQFIEMCSGLLIQNMT